MSRKVDECKPLGGGVVSRWGVTPFGPLEFIMDADERSKWMKEQRGGEGGGGAGGGG